MPKSSRDAGWKWSKTVNITKKLFLVCWTSLEHRQGEKATTNTWMLQEPKFGPWSEAQVPSRDHSNSSETDIIQWSSSERGVIMAEIKSLLGDSMGVTHITNPPAPVLKVTCVLPPAATAVHATCRRFHLLSQDIKLETFACAQTSVSRKCCLTSSKAFPFGWSHRLCQQDCWIWPKHQCWWRLDWCWISTNASSGSFPVSRKAKGSLETVFFLTKNTLVLSWGSSPSDAAILSSFLYLVSGKIFSELRACASTASKWLWAGCCLLINIAQRYWEPSGSRFSHIVWSIVKVVTGCEGTHCWLQ